MHTTTTNSTDVIKNFLTKFKARKYHDFPEPRELAEAIHQVTGQDCEVSLDGDPIWYTRMYHICASLSSGIYLKKGDAVRLKEILRDRNGRKRASINETAIITDTSHADEGIITIQVLGHSSVTKCPINFCEVVENEVAL